GVWREANAGARVVFDPIFAKDSALDGESMLVAERRYHPAHNVGFFRFLECASLTSDGEPGSDLTPWNAIAFPFDPALREREDLGTLPIERMSPRQDRRVLERYTCDASGIVSVTLREESSGYERTYRLSGNLRV